MSVMTLSKKPSGPPLKGSGLPSFRAMFPRGHLPVKRSINFVTVGETPIDWRAAAPAIVLILVLAGLISKIAVADRFAALDNARANVYALESQIQERNAYYNGLEDITADYAHYTLSDMTDEERGRISRVTVIEVIQELILPVAPVEEWSLKENTLSIHIASNTLPEISGVIRRLQDHPAVASCGVVTDSTTVSSTENVATEETVTADITVVFKSALEIQKERETAEEIAKGGGAS